MVELPRPHVLRPFDGPPDARELRVELGSDAGAAATSVPVLALDPPPADRGDAPWSLVVYFDLVLSDRSQVSWAADLLSRNLPEMVRLGPVEVVVADPEPRTVVSPTTDVDRIDQVLDRMIFFPEAEDALVEARLARATGERPAAESAPVSTGAVGASGGSTPLERALVQDRLDRLVLALADRANEADAPRRAVFLVTGGFDLDRDGSLRKATGDAAKTLASYGWTVLPVLMPPPRGTLLGFRIGKWRRYKPTAEEAMLTVPILFAAKRESERDPERAEAYLELALSRQRQGELDDAARAARRAMTHFADHPKTAEQQARALRVLAEVYEAQGHEHLARRTYLRAATRAPEALAGHPVVQAAVERPDEALALLAAGTLGATIRGDGGWEPAMRALDRRGVVSLQIQGPPDGRLHEVRVVRTGEDEAIPSAGVLRFGTPRTVVAARARQLLDDVPNQGELPVSVSLLEEGGVGGTATLALSADPSRLPRWARQDLGGDDAALLRVTVALPRAEGLPEVIHLEPEVIPAASAGPWGWTLRREMPLGDGVRWTAGWGVVVVDELLSGVWGAALAQPAEDR
jgi:hypothetical protein